MSPVNTLPHQSILQGFHFPSPVLCSWLSEQWLTFAKRDDLVFGYMPFALFLF